jgi:hypothetical protein
MLKSTDGANVATTYRVTPANQLQSMTSSVNNSTNPSNHLRGNFCLLPQQSSTLYLKALLNRVHPVRMLHAGASFWLERYSHHSFSKH